MPPDSDPDRDILELVGRGDIEQAARLMMKRHGESIYKFCLGALRERSLCDDVHQRVFIEAVRDLRRFEGRSTLRSWLFGIARNRVLDAIKQSRRAQSRNEQDPRADTPDPSPPAGQQIDDARLEQALLVCLGELDKHARIPVVLRYGDNMSYEDMAQVMRIKAGTLQARVARAMITLRECIERREAM